MSTDIIDLATMRANREGKRVADTMPEIVEEALENRRLRAFSRDEQPEEGPPRLEEIAEVALDRYNKAKQAAQEVYRAERAKNDGPGRASYSAPDKSRPWDVSDRGGPTVTEEMKERLEEVMLHLLANNPEQAAEHLRFTAHKIENAVKRQHEKTVRAKRAERQERKRQKEREGIEREERRLARERERVRKRL